MDGMASDEELMLLKFAQKLAGNEKKYRDRSLVKFRKWLSSKCSSDNDDDMLLKIWKGLHYCMWMSDKALVQEDLANQLAGLVHVIQDPKVAISFIKAYLRTQAREWAGIDHFRIDKFMMLMRRYWCESLVLLKRYNWSEELFSCLIDVLRGGVLSGMAEDFPDGMRFHFADIFWDELEKVAADDLNADQVMMILDPVCQLLAETKNEALQKRLIKRILEPPLYWDEEDDSDAEEDSSTHCNVDLVRVSDRLFDLGSNKNCHGKGRSCVYSIVKRYRAKIQGQTKTLVLPNPALFNTDPIAEDLEKAAKRLVRIEEKIIKSSNKSLSKREKKRQRRKESEALNEDEDKSDDKDDDGEPAPKKTKAGKMPKSPTGSSQSSSPKNKKKAGKDQSKDKENGTSTTSQGQTDCLNSSSPKKKKKAGSDKENGSSTASQGEKTSPTSKNLSKATTPSTAPGSLPASLKKDAQSKNSKLTKGSNVLADKNTPVKQSEEKTPKIINDIETPKAVNENITNGLKASVKNSVSDIPSKKMRRKSKTLEIEETGETVIFDSDKDGNQTKMKSSEIKKKSVKSESSKTDVITNSSTSKENAILTPSKAKKLKRKSSDKSVTEDVKTPTVSNETVTEDGDVEIWIPNKKYKGPQKQPETPISSSRKTKTAPNSASPALVKFDKLKKTPPAFVNKAVRKATPKTGSKKTPKQSLIDEDNMTASEKKRVSFVMTRNMAQEFEESLLPSPVPAFNPLSLPDQGILKASPAGSPIFNPKQQLFKKRRRSKASDFFLEN